MSKFKLLESEKVLEDNYPVYFGYAYIVDGIVRKNNILMRGTIGQLKKELGADEIRRLELFIPEREGIKTGDIIE